MLTNIALFSVYNCLLTKYLLSLFEIIKMRTLFLIAALGLLLGCNPNNNNPQQVNWKFEFKLNGVSHKAQGVGLNFNSNYAYTSGLEAILLKINDQSDPSYISGNNGELQITFANPSVGTQSLTQSNTLGSWWTDLADQNGIYIFNGYSLTSGGPQVPNSNGGLGPALPITITDLGTAGNGSYQGGTVFKGNYNGTLYFPSNPLTFPLQYNNPVVVSLNFEALRP